LALKIILTDPSPHFSSVCINYNLYIYGENWWGKLDYRENLIPNPTLFTDWQSLMW